MLARLLLLRLPVLALDSPTGPLGSAMRTTYFSGTIRSGVIPDKVKNSIGQ